MVLMINKILFLVTVVLSSMSHSAFSQSSELKVMSYNIRQGSIDDGDNSWTYRRAATLAMLEDQRPDVFGVQEALEYQVKYIDEKCSAYDCIGVGREDGKKEGEFMSIFWNKKTVKMLKWGTFWLAETPEKPSKGWDAACYRTATWALMKDRRTGQKFYFVNTHLDHIGVEARRNSLKLIVDRIATINPEGLPMVLTGDFNMKPSAQELKVLDSRMENARAVALKTDDHNTFNGWGKGTSDQIIDYIFMSGFRFCPEFHTVTEKYAQRTYLSDHYPIVARLVF